jgi:TPR repeat protein
MHLKTVSASGVCLLVCLAVAGLALPAPSSADTRSPAEIRTKAEQGDSAAQFNLGVMYAKGQGVGQDYMEAAKWYRKAAEQGYAPAQCKLGTMYFQGHGVTQDYAEAVRWFHKAAEEGQCPGTM